MVIGVKEPPIAHGDAVDEQTSDVTGTYLHVLNKDGGVAVSDVALAHTLVLAALHKLAVVL